METSYLIYVNGSLYATCASLERALKFYYQSLSLSNTVDVKMIENTQRLLMETTK